MLPTDYRAIATVEPRIAAVELLATIILAWVGGMFALAAVLWPVSKLAQWWSERPTLRRKFTKLEVVLLGVVAFAFFCAVFVLVGASTALR
jgi:hypothetical protein